MTKDKEVYVADFETSHETKNGIEYAWVWCAGYQRIYTDSVKALNLFGNINDFLNSLMSNKSKKVYFHNLKFDGQFILSYFLNLGYKKVQAFTAPKQINYLVDNLGSFYSISVSFKNTGGQLRRLVFLDSAKIYPYSLKTLAKQMNMPTSKGDLDYNKVRYPNHVLTTEELDYFKRDIMILKIAIEKAYTEGYKKMTIGANALEQYKNTLDLEGRSGKWVFKDIFPKLNPEADEFIRKSYRGGCCMLNEKYSNKITPIHSYDINSMYPSMLYYKHMPFGVAKKFEGKWQPKANKVCVQCINCAFFIKQGFLPTIQVKGNKLFKANEWIKNCAYNIDLYLTNVDLELFFKHYDVVDITYKGGYEFNTSAGLFKKYIDKWMSIKANTQDEGERLFAKLFLNNIYGKFATNPKRYSTIFGLENGVVKRVDTMETECESIYLPVGVFTTSYARAYLINYAQANYDKFVYCDTDSLHLLAPTDNLPLDNSKLGYFKYEYYGKAKHIKQKTYIAYVEKENKFNKWYSVNKYQLTCAGLNKDILEGCTIDFDSFKLGATFPKLVMRRVVGGVYLSQELHTIT